MAVVDAVSDIQSILEELPSGPLRHIGQKVEAGVRLSAEEGLALLHAKEHEDAVARLADFDRRRKVGDNVYYCSTFYVHPTNLCELSCPMCSYYAKPGWAKAWFFTPAQIEEKVRPAYAQGLTEIHVVGGLWRDCNLDYYEELFGRIKAIDPKLHIKALTPVEYDFLAKLHGISIDEVFQRMIGWGLGSLPGGGAEVLVEEIRKQLAPQKITSEEYMAIHRKAHLLDLPSNITMLFGHVEEPQHLITHLCWVRELQDETKGFRTFVPLKYHPENNALGKRAKRLKGEKSLKLVYATSRLMLDNVPHLKALWKYVGVSEAQELLKCGANDLSSTYQEEQIIEMAGGVRQRMTRELLSQLILDLGRTPVEVHSAHASLF